MDGPGRARCLLSILRARGMTSIGKRRHRRVFGPQAPFTSTPRIACPCFFDRADFAYLSEHGEGLDGTSYELRFGEYFGWCRIKWWVKIPESWKAISPAVKRFGRVLQSPPATEYVE